MRVIGGEFRSRRLKSLPGDGIRPTPDRLRESLFNVLSTVIEDATFIDAYAGTGAVGIEALSRGARHVAFIESDRAAAQLIRENLATLGITTRADVVHGKALHHLERRQAGIVFMDPPYSLEREYQAALELLGERAPPLLIVQHATRFILAEEYGSLRRTRLLTQGENTLSFYKPSATPDAPT